MVNYNLENKVVLITGANHGIGAATAKAFAAQGAKVFITYYRNPTHYSIDELEKARKNRTGGRLLYAAMRQQSANTIVDEICSNNGTAFTHETDLADPNNIPTLFDLCEKQLGLVDILVNNHTHAIPDTFDPKIITTGDFDVHLTTAADIDAHFAVNTRAYTLMMMEYLKRYLKRSAKWGRIINLSTDAAHTHVGMISYASSKHAIESYSRSAAAEMGKYGITVNIVAPGPTQTGYLTPEQEADIIAKAPLRRVGKPEDVADVIVFLASEQARWLTGQLIYVGGGWRMHQ
jgi:3-oxoacyl-[acyl-carrier protein] reductase